MIDNYLSQLNSAQLKAVKHQHGPLIITAGPGTGKTKTLTARILYLIKEKNLVADQILALTFTKKAAWEIQDRLQSTLVNNLAQNQPAKKLPLIHTFHSLAYQALTDLKQPINLINDQDRIKLIRELLKNNPVLKHLINLDTNELALLISKWKNFALNQKKIDHNLSLILNQYQAVLTQANLIDYDDLLLKFFHLIKNQPDQKKYPYILVDEFQDVNEIQYQILKQLIEKNNFFIIGDPQQAIYSFRGANAKSFDQFKKDFPQYTEIVLTKNYRSGQKILNSSQSLFIDHSQQVKNQPDQLQAQVEFSGQTYLINTYNEYHEADLIVKIVSQLMGGLDFQEASALNQGDQNKTELTMDQENKSNFSDFAVIYRLHNLNRVLEKKFEDSGIPYQIIGKESFWHSKEIQSIIDLLKIKKNQDQNINQKTTLSNLVKQIIVELDLENQLINKSTKLKNLYQLKSILPIFDHQPASIEFFLNYLTKLERKDYYDQQTDKVTLLTMHAAKGLEFKHVFIMGFEDGLIPFYKKTKIEEELAEEKRLLYVAMTRAKNNLYLIYPQQRYKKNNQQSFFYPLIKNQLIQVDDQILNRLKLKKAKAIEKKRQLPMF